MTPKCPPLLYMVLTHFLSIYFFRYHLFCHVKGLPGPSSVSCTQKVCSPAATSLAQQSVDGTGLQRPAKQRRLASVEAHHPPAVFSNNDTEQRQFSRHTIE
mmetsp:Transcript_37961/g.63035  ORF Transcript_37961/g.63035 Transcript_37961/m.63035 type:complete len:101 (+) Transcript_37961:4152-4454(+)